MHGLVIDRDDRVVPGIGDQSTATFSPCRTYRYALTRCWSAALPQVAFVMLNPSTADAFNVDPTIRRCLAFARTWGAGGLTVLNAFALRSTDPRALYKHADPVGPANDAVIASVLTGDSVSKVVVAWGQHGMFRGRGAQVADLLCGYGIKPLCLGLTKGGHPRHPLYVPGDTATLEYGVS